MAIPEVMSYLERIKTIHEKKNADYAAQTNPFENFERSAELMSWFNNHTDKAFVSLIGTKLARLATLLNKDSQPNNESIDDSFLDLMTYCILWGSNYSRRTVPLDLIQSGAAKETLSLEPNPNLQRYQCKRCGGSFNHTPFVTNIPGIPAVSYFFCSPKCQLTTEKEP